VTHAPGGRAPIIPMLLRGINVSITTDRTAPHRMFDLLQTARQVQFAHRLIENDDYLLPVGRLLEMITVDAAKALELDQTSACWKRARRPTSSSSTCTIRISFRIGCRCTG